MGPGVYTLVFTYQEAGPCLRTDSIIVRVIDAPTADFGLVDDEICTTQSTVAAYTGSAGPGAMFTWDFGGARVLTGSGAGPYTLQWEQAGIYTLALGVTGAGCLGALSPATAVVTVVAPLDSARLALWGQYAQFSTFFVEQRRWGTGLRNQCRWWNAFRYYGPIL
ncbi:MAG: hypothetical protein HC821_03570 [Lewinella sp.]|nr:hypothetical protein [Lewinella sp.]